MNPTLFWATVLSPIVWVVAIIVALIIARRSSKETKKQIEVVYNLWDVFVAAQNPTMLEAKRKYELQLAELDKQIQEQEVKMSLDLEERNKKRAELIEDGKLLLEERLKSIAEGTAVFVQHEEVKNHIKSMLHEEYQMA